MEKPHFKDYATFDDFSNALRQYSEYLEEQELASRRLEAQRQQKAGLGILKKFHPELLNMIRHNTSTRVVFYGEQPTGLYIDIVSTGTHSPITLFLSWSGLFYRSSESVANELAESFSAQDVAEMIVKRFF